MLERLADPLGSTQRRCAPRSEPTPNLPHLPSHLPHSPPDLGIHLLGPQPAPADWPPGLVALKLASSHLEPGPPYRGYLDGLEPRGADGPVDGIAGDSELGRGGGDGEVPGEAPALLVVPFRLAAGRAEFALFAAQRCFAVETDI